jgi:hypothetical protein
MSVCNRPLAVRNDLPCGAFAAQHTATTAAQHDATTAPPKPDAVLLWLADPQVQAWLKQQQAVEASPKNAEKPETNSVSH